MTRCTVEPRSPAGLVVRVVAVPGGPAAAGARQRVVELLLRAAVTASGAGVPVDSAPLPPGTSVPPPVDPSEQAA